MMLFVLAIISATMAKVSSAIDFEIEYTPGSLTQDVWHNVGTLNGKDITALKGTVRDMEGTNALCFDESQSNQTFVNYIDYDINSDANPELTMIIWENTDSNVVPSGHIFLGHGNVGYDRAIRVNDDKFGGGIAAGVGSKYTSTISAPTPGEWTSITVTFSKSMMEATVYKNGGILFGGEQQEVTITSDSGGLRQTSLNGLQNYENRILIGCIGRVQIVNRVLSANEVARVFSEGIEGLPIPGEVYTLNSPNITGNFTLNLKTNFVDPTETTECYFEIDEFNMEKQLGSASYITITKDLYDAFPEKYTDNSFLLMTEEVLLSPSLPSNCTQYPALKITSVQINDKTVQLFVQKAMFYEYIDEMDVNASHIPLFNNGEEPIIFPPNPDDIINNPNNTNMTNVTVMIAEVVCAEYDDDGNEIAETPLDDGECGTETVEGSFGGEYTGGFNEASTRRRSRRLLGLFKKLKKKVVSVAKSALEVVEEVAETYGGQYVALVKTVISLLTGDVNERLSAGITFSNTILFEVSGSQQLEQEQSQPDTPERLSVSVDGDFTIDAGVEFTFEAYVHFVAKYKLFSSKPSFDYFKLVIGAQTNFQTWIYVTLHGGIHIAYELVNVEKEKTFFIGPVPIVLTIYGSISIGLNIDITLSLSLRFGYEPIYIEYGFEWTKGWSEPRQISDANLDLKFIKEFGGNVGDSGSCFLLNIEPFVTLQFGIIFYQLVDVYVLGEFGIPTDLRWPGSCQTNTNPCDYDTNQLQFDVAFRTDISIGTVIGFAAADLGLPEFGFQYLLPLPTLPSIPSQCVPLSIPFLDDICCFNGAVRPFPITFELEYTPGSLTQDVWQNVGTLSGKDITALKGTVRDIEGTNALCFDDSQSDETYTNYIDYDINSDVNPELTMIIWENTDSNAVPSGHIFLGHGNVGYDRAIRVNDDRFGGGIAAGVGSTYTSTISAPTPGEWTSITVTFSKSMMEATVYKNGGILSGGEQQEVTITRDSGGLRQTSLNGLQNYENRILNGCIGRVQIVNRVLSATEVASVFREGIEELPIDSAKTISYNVDTHPEESMSVPNNGLNGISYTLILMGLIAIFLCGVIGVCFERIIGLNKRPFLKYSAVPHHVNVVIDADESPQSEEECILEK